MSIEYTPGEFRLFRAETKFHLGSIAQDIDAGASIQFDGNTARINGKEHDIPILRSAVKSGWLVLADSPPTAYRPKPADITMRPAVSTKAERGAPIQSNVLHEEERDLGTLKDVRQGATARKPLVVRDDDQDGIVVSRIKSATKQAAVITNQNVQQIAQTIHQLDSLATSSSRPQREAIAFSDAQETRFGDELDELLGDTVASSGTPEAKVVGERVSPSAPEKASPPARVNITWEMILDALPVSVTDVLVDQGVDDVEVLREALADPIAGVALTSLLKIGPTLRLRKMLGLT